MDEGGERIIGSRQIIPHLRVEGSAADIPLVKRTLPQSTYTGVMNYMDVMWRGKFEIFLSEDFCIKYVHPTQ